jgi:hypothetical protein
LVELEQRLARLQAEAVLHEHPFTSTKPVLGPIIVGFRRLWNAIATRWYILPVLEQQTSVNQQVAEALSEVVRTLRQESRAPAVDSTLWRILAADQATLAQAVGALGADGEESPPQR